jgi:hypothetical protein
MPLVAPTTQHGWCSFALTGLVGHDAGADGTVGHIINPEGAAIAITRCVVYAITNSTGAANLTVGIGATVAAAHDATELAAAHALAAAVGTAWEGMQHGDVDDAPVILAADSYIAAYASADSSGFTGRCYIEYVRVGE